jgi:hypothetical protein
VQHLIGRVKRRGLEDASARPVARQKTPAATHLTAWALADVADSPRERVKKSNADQTALFRQTGESRMHRIEDLTAWCFQRALGV